MTQIQNTRILSGMKKYAGINLREEAYGKEVGLIDIIGNMKNSSVSSRRITYKDKSYGYIAYYLKLKESMGYSVLPGKNIETMDRENYKRVSAKISGRIGRLTTITEGILDHFKDQNKSIKEQTLANSLSILEFSIMCKLADVPLKKAIHILFGETFLKELTLHDLADLLDSNKKNKLTPKDVLIEYFGKGFYKDILKTKKLKSALESIPENKLNISKAIQDQLINTLGEDGFYKLSQNPEKLKLVIAALTGKNKKGQ